MSNNLKVESIREALKAIENSEVGVKSKAAAKRVDEEARKNPWAFVGVTALFALIFGFFFGRKSKD